MLNAAEAIVICYIAGKFESLTLAGTPEIRYSKIIIQTENMDEAFTSFKIGLASGRPKPSKIVVW